MELERKVWKKMRARVKKEGIAMDPRWSRFKNFYEDMGPCPEGRFFQLHGQRPNSVRTFRKGGCGWVRSEASIKGTGQFREVTYKGRTMQARDWAEETGLSVAHICQRVRNNWPEGSALGFEPPPSTQDRTYMTWIRLAAYTKRRNITLCKRWQGKYGYLNYLEDMGEKPKGMALTRRDKSKGYSPTNCMYVKRGELQRLRSKNYKVGKESKPLSVWAEETGISSDLLRNRIYQKKVSMGEAIALGKPKPTINPRRDPPEDIVFYNLRSRLTQPKNKSYHNWGGNGYRISKRWMKKENFYEDMGPPPPGKKSVIILPGKTLFKKANCRWGSHSELLAVTDFRGTKVTCRGETRTISDWAKTRGLTFSTVYQRLEISGYTPEVALGFKGRFAEA